MLGVAALVAYLNWPSHVDADSRLAEIVGERAAVAEAEGFADGIGGNVEYYRFRAPQDVVAKLAAVFGSEGEPLAKAHLGQFWAPDPPSWWQPGRDLIDGSYYSGADAAGRQHHLAYDPATGIGYLVRVGP